MELSTRETFRGKRVDTGEWVYGNLIYRRASVGDDILALIVCAAEWDNSTGFYRLCDTHRVIPETIGQSTGTWDKNKTIIFEGDIVKFGINKRPMYVHFNEETLAWELTDVGVPICEVNHLLNTFELAHINVESAYGDMFSEVVGTIYDERDNLK